jgi:hypothetical protein
MKQFDGRGRPEENKEGTRPNYSQAHAARDAGLSAHQQKTAVRVANVGSAAESCVIASFEAFPPQPPHSLRLNTVGASGGRRMPKRLGRSCAENRTGLQDEMTGDAIVDLRYTTSGMVSVLFHRPALPIRPMPACC